MPSPTYGAYNPQATDPYPIETALATAISKDQPNLAFPMLQDYRIQRETAGNQYGDQLAAQHQFAQQELAATIANNKAKNMAELLGKPGGAAVMASTPDYQYGVPMDTLTQLAADDARARQAKIFQEANAGLYSGVQAGYTYPTEGISGMTGLPVSAGTPLALRTEAARAAHAANAEPKQPTRSVATYVPGLGTVTTAYGGKTGINTTDQILADQQKNLGRTPPQQPPSTPGTKAQQPALPQAQRDTPVVTTQVTPESRVNAWINGPHGTPEAKAAVKSTGGTPKLVPGPNGAVSLVDANNKPVANFKNVR